MSSFETVRINPEMASSMLANQRANRTISKHTVNKYAREIESGRWISSILSPIVLDEEGRVIDGQHRLWAIVKSGVEVDAIIVRSDIRTVDLMCENRARTAADRFKIFDGFREDTKVLVGVMRLCQARMRGEQISTKSNPDISSVEEMRHAMQTLEDVGCNLGEIIFDAMQIYRIQIMRPRMLFPVTIAYSLISACTDGVYPRMFEHLRAICSDEWNGRTPAQKATRVRLMGSKELRNPQIYAVCKSFNDPSLQRMQIESRTSAPVYVPDVEDGLFATHFPRERAGSIA